MLWILSLPCVFGQNEWSIVKPDECVTVGYFNTATLTCETCPVNSESSAGFPNECKCKKGYKKSYTIDNSILLLSCTLCGEAVSLDGTECVACVGDASLDVTSGKCVCPSGQAMAEKDTDGTFLVGGSSCGVCANTATAGISSCDSCPLELPLPTDGECACDAANLGDDVCFVAPETSTPDTQITRSDTSITSALFTDHLFPVYQQCLDGKNSTACNSLANLCVLQLKSTAGSACTLFDSITRASLSTISSWKESLPWLILSQQDYTQLSGSTEIETFFDYSTPLNLVAATYDVYGNFEGFQEINKGSLQLCKLADNHLVSMWHFGAPTVQTCTVSLDNLGKTTFMDIYLEVDGKLHPLPVETTCDSTCTVPNGYKYIRRVFTHDTVSTTEYVRIMTSAKITTTVKTGGTIFPPKLIVIYSDVRVADLTAAVEFEISYEAESDGQSNTWQIVVGVLIGLFFFISLVPFVSWNRRNGTMMLDGTMIIKFILALLDGVASALFVTSFAFGVYWFLANNSVEVVVLEDHTAMFITVTVLAFVFKLINLVHMIIDQSYADVFFIDWERERPIAEGDQAIKHTSASKISIWRTILAANEWSEIQTTRKTSITLQLFVVIFILEVLNLDDYGCSTPNQSPAFQLNCGNDNQRSDSVFLRSGLAMIVYGGTALVQFLINRLILSMFYNPVLNFIDLLSVMNISLLTLTHKQFGYYVHGKSAHGRADTDMLDLQQCLRRETNGQTGSRGLEPGQDITTFEMSVTSEFRQYYENFYRSLMMNVGGNMQNEDDQNKNQVESYRKLNQFLQKFFMHGLPQLKLQFLSKGMWEKFMDIEFTSQTGLFTNNLYRDSRGESIANALFYGNESHLLVFEILSFIVFDIAFNSYIVSAVITYFLSRLFRFIRNTLALRNLSTRTMIDKRFLV